MKQLLSLFLFLVPCLAWAQYPTNGNQKITLGEQTTADGLIWRGVLGDTALITPLSDTSAYIILDTANHRFYNYNRATNVWSVAGGGTSVTTFSGGTTGLTPNTATSGAVTLGGTLAVANGGTGSATQNFVDLTTTQSSIAGAKTFTSAVTATRFDPTSSTATGTGMFLPAANRLGFSTNGTERISITSGGNVGIGISNPVIAGAKNFTIEAGASACAIGLFSSTGTGNARNWMIAVNNNANGDMAFTQSTGIGVDPRSSGVDWLYIKPSGEVALYNLAGTGSRAVLADANGVLSAPVSSINTKENVQILDYGLNELLQINPVSFDYINKDKWGEERNLGFIVEDMFPIIPEVTGTMNTGDMYLDMTKLIPILTKAIQEQNALIKSLEQRLLILENK
jgi:hypothetical protein